MSQTATAQLGLALAIALGQLAHADAGPGFGVSHYQSTASAHTTLLGASDFETAPDATASASVMVGPFNGAVGEARDLVVQGNALACCGGAGEAGAGGDSKILFDITSGDPNALYDLTFYFSEETQVAATPPGDQTIVSSYLFTVGTEDETVTVSPENEIRFGASGPPTISTAGFKAFSFKPTNGGYLFTGSAVVNVQARDFVLLDDELGIDDSTSGGPVDAVGAARLEGFTIAPGFAGPAPVLSSPGAPTLTPGLPEPAAWAEIILGICGCGCLLRTLRAPRVYRAVRQA